MNDEHVAEELLQRYFDGDLLPASARQVAEHIGRCETCAGAHGQLRQLQRLIGVTAVESARDVDFNALFSRVERGIRDEGRASLGERIAMWWSALQRRDQVFVPMAGALAAAVVLLVVLRNQPHEQPGAQTGAAPGVVQSAPATDEVPPPPPVEMAAMSSEIEQVDFGGNTGTVFEVALADGVSTPVVWINDEQ